jgi:hypothetical protein
MTPETLRRILDPEPGTPLWRAKEYGIDLTLLAENLQQSTAERVRRVTRSLQTAEWAKEVRERRTDR